MKTLFDIVAVPFRAAYERDVKSLYDYARQNPHDPLYRAIESELLKEVQTINRQNHVQKNTATPSSGVLAA